MQTDSTPAPAFSELPPAPEPPRASAETPASSTDGWRAKIAFWLTTQRFISGTPHHIGDLMLAVSDEFPQATLDDLNAILAELQREGICESMRKGGELHWRATETHLRDRQPRSEADGRIVAVLNRVLSSGASYSEREIQRNVRAELPDVEPERLTAVLDRLARERRVAVVSVGPQKRYQKRIA